MLRSGRVPDLRNLKPQPTGYPSTSNSAAAPIEAVAGILALGTTGMTTTMIDVSKATDEDHPSGAFKKFHRMDLYKQRVPLKKRKLEEKRFSIEALGSPHEETTVMDMLIDGIEKNRIATLKYGAMRRNDIKFGNMM